MSGDAAFADEEGFITVMGRMDHTIKSGAENIHPSEVENVLFKHPGIANAAAVGLPSRKWGQVVCAAIVRKERSLTAEMLDAFCLESPDLADFKRPRHYFFIEEIPANPTGKVERGKLKELLMKQVGRVELDCARISSRRSRSASSSSRTASSWRRSRARAPRPSACRRR